MKKLILSLIVVAFAFASNAQVVVRGVSPAAIANNFAFEWADPAGGDWSCPDFLVPNTFVEAPIMLVDDGTPGVNEIYAYQHPLAQESCNPLVNDLTGKIAVFYRGSCQFGTKAYNAQVAGAVGCIIINHTGDAVGMAGGDDGLNVTIPLVMVSEDDGATIVAEMLNGEVVMFMGNKQNLYANDGGSAESDVLSPRYGSIPQAMANNNYTFQVGMQMYNFGSSDNTFSVTASVDGPSGNVYSNTISAFVASGDTLAIFNGFANEFSTVSAASWEVGNYKVTYTIAIDGQTDESDFDNTYVRDFSITNDVLSLAHVDEATSMLTVNSFPSNAATSYQTCMQVQDIYPGSSYGVEGLYFAVNSPDTVLVGEEVLMDVFEWNDPWVDVSGGWAGITFDALDQVGGGLYYPTSNADNGMVVYAPLDEAVSMYDDQRYLVCLSTFNPAISFGYDNSLDYDANYSIYLQPISPLNIDDTWYSGWTGTSALSLGLKMVDNLGIEEVSEVSGRAYPNPAADQVMIDVDGEGSAVLVVSDIAGKVALSNQINLNGGKSSIDISSLDNGVYMFNVTLENGSTSTFSVVKE